MPLPTFVVSLNNGGSRAGMEHKNAVLFLVQFKAEQFIIKNENIKRGGGTRFCCNSIT